MKWLISASVVLLVLCLVFGPDNVGHLLGRIMHNLSLGALHFTQAVWQAGRQG